MYHKFLYSLKMVYRYKHLSYYHINKLRYNHNKLSHLIRHHYKTHSHQGLQYSQQLIHKFPRLMVYNHQ